MESYDRLIFVSKGDTDTGPMAEAIMQEKYLLDVPEFSSKGLVVLFPEPINPKAEAVLASHGLTMKEHMSDPLMQEDIGEQTLVLALSEEIRDQILENFPDIPAERVQVLYQYVDGEEGPSDPYGGTLADYGKCYVELEALITKLAAMLSEEECL